MPESARVSSKKRNDRTPLWPRSVRAGRVGAGGDGCLASSSGAAGLRRTIAFVPGKLQDRIALITGSSQGMGAGIARCLHREGACILLHGRELERGRELARELRQSGPDADFHDGDLADPEACRSLVAAAVARFGGLDILVNCAGDTSRGTVADTSLELWDRIFAVNVRAPFLLIQAALPHLRQSRSPAIVNIGSINAYIGEPRLLAYSASKGALMTMTKNLASGLGRERIRVNQINPGWTLTEGEEQVKTVAEGNPGWKAEALRSRPFGRLLLPEDIGRAALFLASDDSAAMSGAILDYEQFPVGAPPNW